MLRPFRAAAVAALALGLALGAAGCGGDDDKKKASPEPTASSTPTASAPAVPVPGAPTAIGNQGLPETFPDDAVPLLPGQVSQPLGDSPAGEEGKRGWVLEVKVDKTPADCFAAAAAELVGAGFTKAGELDAEGVKQAQYTTAEYAVIISARSDGATGCTLGYEVGQVSK